MSMSFCAKGRKTERKKERRRGHGWCEGCFLPREGFVDEGNQRFSIRVDAGGPAGEDGTEVGDVESLAFEAREEL